MTFQIAQRGSTENAETQRKNQLPQIRRTATTREMEVRRSKTIVSHLSASLPRVSAYLCAYPELKRVLPSTPRVSILKPIKGTSTHRLTRTSLHFAKQDYDNYEILFAVTDSDDPAIPEIQRLQREFPHIPIRWVYRGTARAQSQVRQPPSPRGGVHYRRPGCSVMETSASRRTICRASSRYNWPDPSVGLVTMPLSRRLSPGPGGTRLESLAHGCHLPPGGRAGTSPRASHRNGRARWHFAEADLLRTGGFVAIADHLMDDYQVAALIEGLGLKTCLSDYVVGSTIGRPGFSDQWAREVRWSRGIRVTTPGKYWGLLVTYPTVWALALCIVGGLHPWILIVLGGTLLLRWIVAWDIEMLLAGERPHRSSSVAAA